MTEIERGSRKDSGAAASLSRNIAILPYFPKGTHDEWLGTLGELAGTFDDMDRSAELMRTLEQLAATGADLHDKSAMMDAIWARCPHFVTNDRHLVGNGPRARIEGAFPIHAPPTKRRKSWVN